MAVIMEAFSIREYASRMRSVDVVKCWPFGEASEENVKAILPTITVKKFRWWLDEVEKLRINCLENERNYGIEEVEEGKEEEDESDRDSENLASVRRRKLQKMKLKGKAPKKRSIVELFAVAPEVERAMSSEDEDEDEDEDEGSIEEKGFGKLQSFGTKNSILSCKTKQVLCTGEKQKKAGKHSKQKAFNKNKRGITTKEKICKFKSVPSHNSTPNPYGSDNISMHSKTKVNKSLATDARAKARRTSKLIAKNRKEDFQGRGMLKGLTKTRVSENKISLLKIQNLNKKYALSVKDDVWEGSRPHMELDFLKHSDLSVGVTVGNTVHRHADIEKSVSIQEMEETEEETYKWRGNHINKQPPFENQLCVKCHVNEVPNRSKLLNRSMPSDQCAWHNDNLLSCVEYDRRKEHDASLYPCSTGTSLLHLPEDIDAQASSSARSMDYFKLYPQSLPSYSSTPNNSSVNSNPQFPLKKFGEDYNELSLQRPRIPSMSPKELMRTVCCIPDQRSTMQMYGERSIRDDLFGLPLNSQGELIRLSYIENGDMYQLGGGPNICSNIPSESLLGSIGARQDDQYTAFPKSEIIQHSCSSMQLTPSTMRLMGQEFRIDGRGFRRPENREFYKDKEIMADQHLDSTAANGSSFKSLFLSESVGCDYNGCRGSGNLSHMMAPKSTTFQLFEDQKGCGFSKRNSPHPTYPHASVSADFVSRGHINSILPENISGYRSLRGSQTLVPAIVFHDTCKNATRSWLQPEHTEMAVPAGKLPSEFPFPFSVFRGNIRPLSLERSFEANPPGRFEAREKGLVMGYNQAFGGSDSVHPPWPTYQTTEPSNLFPHYGSQNTSASASMIHHPLLPVRSLQYDDDEKMKYQKRYKNSRTGSRMLNHENATKKRPASTISNHYTKPIKMPRSSGIQEDFTSTATPVVNTRPNLNWDIGYHGLGSDFASGKYKPHTVGYGDKNEKIPRMSRHRSGPVKLTAGAKHFLKPCHRKESMNEPSISTTPFAANQPAEVIAQVRKP